MNRVCVFEVKIAVVVCERVGVIGKRSCAGLHIDDYTVALIDVGRVIMVL